jgi:hypothetical protein
VGHPWTARFRAAAAPSARVALFIGRQPGWALKAAAVAATAVLLSIAALLVVPAVLVGMIVLLIAGGIIRLRGLLGRALPRRDGRENVRVIVRHGP